MSRKQVAEIAQFISWADKAILNYVCRDDLTEEYLVSDAAIRELQMAHMATTMAAQMLCNLLSNAPGNFPDLDLPDFDPNAHQ